MQAWRITVVYEAFVGLFLPKDMDYSRLYSGFLFHKHIQEARSRGINISNPEGEGLRLQYKLYGVHSGLLKIQLQFLLIPSL